MTSKAHFFMSPEEARPYVETAWRYLRARGVNNRTDIVDRTEFQSLAREALEFRVLACRAADGTGRVIAAIDTSDC
jgi:hypothetical protein